LLAHLAYAAGIGLVVGMLSIAVALANFAFIDHIRRALPYINRIGGAVLVAVGSYVAYYGYYEVRLFAANGSPDDPIITAAGRVQRALAGWVYAHGAWPWVLGTVGCIAVAVLTRLVRRRAARASASNAPGVDILRTTSTSRTDKEMNGP